MPKSENLNLQRRPRFEPRWDAYDCGKKKKRSKHGARTLATGLDKINDFSQNEIIGRQWKRWRKEWLYGTLGLFHAYRVVHELSSWAAAPIR